MRNLHPSDAFELDLPWPSDMTWPNLQLDTPKIYPLWKVLAQALFKTRALFPESISFLVEHCTLGRIIMVQWKMDYILEKLCRRYLLPSMTITARKDNPNYTFLVCSLETSVVLDLYVPLNLLEQEIVNRSCFWNESTKDTEKKPGVFCGCTQTSL